MNLPDIRQVAEYDCGPACAESVCTFFVPNFYAGLLAGLNTSPTDGCDPRTLERFFRNFGLRVVSGEMTQDDLRFHTDRGRPVVTPIAGHYVIVTQALPRVIYLHDPLTGPRKMKFADFAKVWRDHDRIETFTNWGIAVYRG